MPTSRDYHALDDAGPGDRVTAIEPTKRDPDRLTIKVAGKVVTTLGRRRVEDLGLAVGTPWTGELAAAVTDAAAFDKALRDATRRLARRPMSRRQVRDKLHERDHAPEAIDRTLHRLDELGLLDDAAFGRMLIDELRRARPAGDRLLLHKLRQKGLDPGLAERLVRESASARDPVADARAVIDKAMPRLARLDDATRRRRLYGTLARRGFDADTIAGAIAASLGDDEP